jgi:hypothetical protein
MEIPSDNRIRHLPRCVRYHGQSFRLEVPDFYVGSGSRIQKLYSGVQIGLSIALYVRSVLLVENFDLRLSSHYILVTVIPISFSFDINMTSMLGTDSVIVDQVPFHPKRIMTTSASVHFVHAYNPSRIILLRNGLQFISSPTSQAPDFVCLDSTETC